MSLLFGIAFTAHVLAGDWNEVHPLVRYEREGWTAGAMLNSESNFSVLAGYTFRHEDLWLELGGATGYSGGPVVPWIRAGYRGAFIAPAATTEGEIGLVFGLQFLMESR